jgi:hypothetical protein
MDSTGSGDYLMVGVYDHDNELFGLAKSSERNFCTPEHVSAVLDIPCRSVTEWDFQTHSTSAS